MNEGWLMCKLENPDPLEFCLVLDQIFFVGKVFLSNPPINNAVTV